MGTQKVGGFQNIGQRILDRFRTPSPAPGPPAERSPADRSGTGRRTGAGDRVEISGKAREMMNLRDTIAVGREALAGTPEVRGERLAEVKSRLGRGYYESPTVHERVASRIGRVLQHLEEL